MYVLHLQRIEAEVALAHQAAAVFAAAGAKGVEWPALADAVAEFDRWLLAPPKVVDTEQAELLDALGVGRG